MRISTFYLMSPIFVIVLSGSACSPSSLVDVQSPSTVVDPSTVQTASGAVGLRNAALYAFAGEFWGSTAGGGVVQSSGLITDELKAGFINFDLDARYVGATSVFDYDAIQAVRVNAQLAREGLQAYATGSAMAPRAWLGELYAWQGYAVLWLAENFCNGIPLTNVPLVGQSTPTRGFTTAELFTRAILYFDSAVVLGADSTSYVNLAKVGKGRALLGLGRFSDADSVVASVPTGFLYQLDVSATNPLFAGPGSLPQMAATYQQVVQDREGTNGLMWSTDVRTGVVPRNGVLTASKYNITSSGTIDPTYVPSENHERVADGLEARLIQAEAALAREDASWLNILNELRSSCVATAPCAPVPGISATSLPALTDPDIDSARVTLLFRERAMWLYLTGHREGDLRRLARVYKRPIETLWPSGIYSEIVDLSVGMVKNSGRDGASYGSDAVLLPGTGEQLLNNLYTGCFDENP